MNENRQDIVGELKNIESKIDSGSIESAREELRALRKRLDVTESTGVTGSQDGRTIGVEIDIWSYEYKDSIYFVTSDYASISEAVSELVSVDHIGLEEVSALGGCATFRSRQRDRRGTPA